MSPVLAGRYQIEQELGKGGFGLTYLAQDLHLPGYPLCVVKQLKPQFKSPKQLKTAQRLFETEAKALQKLGKYPQIPQLLAYFTEEGEFYLVQEYIQGHELSQEIHPGQPWSEEQVIQLLQDILTPLKFLHDHQVIHRDIKPNNLMRRKPDQTLVLIDFGAVKQHLSELTQLGEKNQRTVRVGTPGYMPSEQAVGQPKFCSDIYAVGMIAIEALTGKPALSLPADLETLEIIWQPFATHASPRLREVLQNMVRYHFNSRYVSAQEALEEVNRLQTSTVPTPAMDMVQLKPESTQAIDKAHLKTVQLESLKSTLLSVPQPYQGSLSKFSFEVVTVNAWGKIIQQENREAQYFREDLGEGIVLDMVAIPGGEFLMGSPEGEGSDDEKPQHLVTVPPFYMGKFLITQAQWHRVASFPQVNISLESNPSYFKGENLPVEQVSWYDCQEFCARLSQYTGNTYCLPSEAEWEYACRAGTTTPFHFGETLTTDLANYDGNYSDIDDPEGKNRAKTTSVGSFPPNGFGLYDMHGNLWEWCADHWHDRYDRAPADGSIWLDSDEWTRRVIRGGSWFLTYSIFRRSADRNHRNAGDRYCTFGLRIVHPVVPDLNQ